MNRLSWIIVTILISSGLAAVYFARTANKELKPFLGKWNGAFETQNKQDKVTGFVQLYASNEKFTMHLEGAQQDIDVTGTWVLVKPTRIELKAKEVKIDDAGGTLRRDPNKPYIPDANVREAYSKPMIFDLSADKEKLDGLMISVGPITGTHRFTRTFGHVQ